MARVLNKHKTGIPKNSVYIGRGSKWGNPFIIGRDGDRSDVIRKYEAWILSQQYLLDSLSELEGRDLVCYCAPKPCHGDILIRLLEARK